MCLVLDVLAVYVMMMTKERGERERRNSIDRM